MEILIASDHAGYDLKKQIELFFKDEFTWIDFGTFSTKSVDYPDFIHPLAKAIEEDSSKKGVIICGSGNGVSMVANKYKNVRAALCWKTEIAVLARQHNDANILALPARFISQEDAYEIVNIFFSTPFEGGRHQLRVDKINI
jgi:ribose 5-phosphate isomerase B